MATRLFVGGLSWGTTEDSLRDFFSQVGNVVSVTVIVDKFTGKSKGFGFVEMGSEKEAQEAIEKLNGKTLDERTVVVNEARPQPQRDAGFSGSYNRDNQRRDHRQSRGRRSYR